jgi:hypothetical protein
MSVESAAALAAARLAAVKNERRCMEILLRRGGTGGETVVLRQRTRGKTGGRRRMQLSYGIAQFKTSRSAPVTASLAFVSPAGVGPRTASAVGDGGGYPYDGQEGDRVGTTIHVPADSTAGRRRPSR